VKFSSWKDAAELIGIAAIVGSLIFVGLQMRQEQVLARAELGSASFEYMRSVRQALSQPDFANIYVKMLERPSDLTTQEIVIIDGFLHEAVQLVERDCYLVGLGVFRECTSTMNRFYPVIFGSSYAKSWWLVARKGYRQGLVDRISPLIDTLDNGTSIRYIEELRSEL